MKVKLTGELHVGLRHRSMSKIMHIGTTVASLERPTNRVVGLLLTISLGVVNLIIDLTDVFRTKRHSSVLKIVHTGSGIP